MPSRLPPMRRPTSHSSRHDERVEDERRGVRGGQVVPRAAPRQQLLERDVEQVGDRPVRVAVLVVRRPAAVERVAVGDLVGADDAREADVDDVRARDVQPERGSRAGRRAPTASHVGRDEQPRRLAAGAPRRSPIHSMRAEQVERAAGRRAGPTSRSRRAVKNASETRERARARAGRGGGAGNGRRGSTNGTRNAHEQRDPDVRRVDLAPERAVVAARHRPRHAEAGPRLEHRAGAVVDEDLADLLLAPAAEVARPASAPGPS